MMYVKKIQKEEGTIELTVHLNIATWYVDSYTDRAFKWNVTEKWIPKGKRKAVNANNATEEEKLAAMLECWAYIKPV